MARPRLRYIESDGQVYLVQRNGRWTFPTEEEPLDFSIVERHSVVIGDAEVVYCKPTAAGFPAHWVFKDDVPMRSDIDPVVQRSINASLARCVVGVLAVRRDGRILMVRSNRGFTKGMWNIPGGFIDYGEHPEEAAVREIREETGVEIQLGSLVGVYKERFQSPYFMYGFIYEAVPVREEIRTEPTEIEAAEWMEPARAFTETRNPFARAALQKRFQLKIPSASTPKPVR